MAETLIAMENELYDDAGVAPGDVWRRGRSCRNAAMRQPTRCRSLSPRPTAPTFHVSFRDSMSRSEFIFPTARGRSASTASARHRRPATGGSPSSASTPHVLPDGSIAPTGEVSNFLYHNVFEDDVLDVTTPFGDVVLPDDDAPLLLISAGIGCTPSSECCTTSPRRVMTDRSRCCTPTAPQAPMRTVHSSANWSIGTTVGRDAPLVRGHGLPPTNRRDPLRPSRPGRRGHRPWHPGLPLRTAPVHARHPSGPAGQGHARDSHSLRDLRAR